MKEALLLVFANKQDIVGGNVEDMGSYKTTMADQNRSSYDPARGSGAAEAQSVEG